MTDFTGTSGPDPFTGLDDVADTFTFALADIQPAQDTVVGGNGSTEDRLVLTTAGTLNVNKLGVFSQIETIEFSSAGNTVNLTKAFANSALNKTVTVLGFGGNDFISASTFNTQRVIIASGGGTDTVIGGNGSDEFQFTVNQLSGADAVTGGNGNGVDTLTFLNGGNITAAKLANVSQIEHIQLSNAGSTLTLTDALVASASLQNLEVTAGNGNDVIDGSALLGVNALTVTSGAGTDRILGGAGNDNIFFTAAQLTSGDTVTAGAGADVITFTTGGVIDANAFAHVSGVGRLTLSNAGNTVTIDEAFALSGDSLNIFVGAKGTGNDVVNAGAVISEGVQFSTAGGNDNLTGGGAGDEFQFRIGDLSATDSVDGGGGADTLRFINGGEIAVNRLLGVSNIENIVLAQADFPGNALTLDADFQDRNPNFGTLNIFGTDGTDVIDASAFLADSPFPSLNSGVSIVAGAGVDKLLGGATNDTFRFAAANLTSEDVVSGGGGILDTIQFDTGGIVLAAAFANVTDIERVAVSGNTLDLADSLVTTSDDGGRLTVVGSVLADKINALAVSAPGKILFLSNGGDDNFTGGTGEDVFETTGTQITSGDLFVGNGGTDELRLTGSATIAAAQLVNALAGVERIEISGAPTGGIPGIASSNLTLDNTAVADGATLRVESLGSDSVNLTGISGARRMIVEAGSGIDKLAGGAAVDKFEFAVGALTTNDPVGGIAGDVVSGGANTDILKFTTGGQIFSGDLGSVTSMERIDFSDFGNTLLLNDRVIANNRNTTTNSIQVVGGGGNDFVAMPSQNVTKLFYSPLGGDDTGIGGRGNDFFTMTAANLNSRDFFDGGAGNEDVLSINGGNINLDGIAANSIRNFEKIQFAGDSSHNFTLTIDRGDVESIGANDVNVLGTTLDNVLIVEHTNDGDHVNVETSSTGLVLSGTVAFEDHTYRLFLAGTTGPVILAVDIAFLA